MNRFKRFAAASLCAMTAIAPLAQSLSLPVLAQEDGREQQTIPENAVIVNVCDFGADPAGLSDSGPAIEAALDHAKTIDAPVVIRFETGTYQVYPETAPSRELYLSNTVGLNSAWKDKHIGILLEGMSDVIVDGQGSTLMTHGRMTPYAALECTNVEFRNFRFDSAVPTDIDASVESVDGNSAVVYIPETNPFEISGNTLLWQSDISPFTGKPYWTASGSMQYGQRYNLETGYAVRGSAEYLDNVVSIEKLENNRIRLHYSSKPAGVKPGMVYEVRFGQRDEVAGFLWKSTNVKLTDLNMDFVHGFGILFQHCDTITLNGLVFDVKPGSGRTSSVCADDLHFSGNKGKIDIQNCTFRNPHDDPINVHGTFNQVVEKIAPNKIRVRFMHGEAQGFPNYFVGDQIEFCTKQNLIVVPDSVRTVVSVDGPDGRGGSTGEGSGSMSDFILTLDQDIPDEITANAYAVENITYTPDVYIANNRFIESPTRGILCTTRGKVVMENNLFDNMNMAAIYISNDAQGWYESGPVRDMLIRSNTFVRCGSQAIFIDPTNPVVSTENTVHRNIRIEDNLFFYSGKKILDAKSVDGLSFTGNTILRENPISEPVLNVPAQMEAGQSAKAQTEYTAAAADSSRIFSFNGCRNVVIAGNTYDGGLNAGSYLSNMSAADISIDNDAAAAGNSRQIPSSASVRYTSSSPEVVSVMADGTLRALKEGEAQITAHVLLDGRRFESEPQTVAVSSAAGRIMPDSVALAAVAEVMQAGGNLQMEALLQGESGMDESLDWSVVNALNGQVCDFAEIDADGLLHAEHAGLAKVSVRTVNGLEASALISIQEEGYGLNAAAGVSMAVESDPSRWQALADGVLLQLSYQGMFSQQQPGNAVGIEIPEDAGDLDIVVKADGTHDAGWGATGLYLYQDADNYISIERKNRGGSVRRMAVVREVGGSATEAWLGGGVNSGPNVTDQSIWFRLQKTGSTVTGSYSIDGSSWNPVAEEDGAFLSGSRIVLTALDPNADSASPFVKFSDLSVNGKKIALTAPAEAPQASVSVLYDEKSSHISASVSQSRGDAAVFWAVSDTEDGPFVLSADLSGPSCTIPSGMQGKYIKAVAVPFEKDAFGQPVFSESVRLTGSGIDETASVPSSSAALMTGRISGIEKGIEKQKDRTAYLTTASVSEKEAEYTFEPLSENAHMTIRYNGRILSEPAGRVQLLNGNNLFEVHVEAEDGQTIQDYRFSIFKAEDSNDALSVFEIDGTSVLESSLIRTENTRIPLRVQTASSAAKAEVFLDGKVIENPEFIEPASGISHLTVRVTTPTGKMPRLYEVQIVSPDAANAALESAVFNEGNTQLSRDFDSKCTDYSLRASNKILTFDLQAMESQAGIEVMKNGTPIASGTGRVCASARLDEGISNLSVTVTSPDGSQNRTYTFDAEYASVLYLSDLDWTSATVGYGTIHKDASIDGNPLTLFDGEKNVVFAKGIGTHGRSEIVYSLDGLNAEAFDAVIGVDRETGNKPDEANMAFEIFADGVSVYQSGEMNYASTMKKIHLPLEGVSELKLVVDGVRNTWSCHGDWADARITIPESETVRTVSVSSAIPEGGNAALLGEQTVYDREYVTVQADCMPGWRFTGWTGADGAVISSENPYTFQVLDDVVLQAQFARAVQEKADTRLLAMAVSYGTDLKEDLPAALNGLVKAEFEAALVQAQSVLADPDALQADADAAWNRLTRAIHMLGFTSDKSALSALMASAMTIDLDEYRPEGQEEFLAALEYAQEVLNDPKALNGASIDVAIERLQNAMDALHPLEEPDCSLLQMLVDAVKDTDLTLYLSDGVQTFSTMLQQAQDVLADPQSQPQINEAVHNLHDAWLQLRLKADESLLEALKVNLSALEALDLSAYSGQEQQIERMRSSLRELLAAPEAGKTEAENLLRQSSTLLKNLAESIKKDSGIPASANPSGRQTAGSVKTAVRTGSGMLAGLSASGMAAGLLAWLRRRRQK